MSSIRTLRPERPWLWGGRWQKRRTVSVPERRRRVQAVSGDPRPLHRSPRPPHGHVSAGASGPGGLLGCSSRRVRGVGAAAPRGSGSRRAWAGEAQGAAAEAGRGAAGPGPVPAALRDGPVPVAPSSLRWPRAWAPRFSCSGGDSVRAGAREPS